MDDGSLSTPEQIEILKTTWPEEFSLIDDDQLYRIVSRQVTLTRPDVGSNFDISPFNDIISAALGLLAVFASYWASAKSNGRSPSHDVREVPTEEELIEHSRSFVATRAEELDNMTVTVIAREYIRITKKKRAAQD